ncbi:hypothetical protein [Bacillus sp. 3255]|uniref:hypothetical protein n=1 Tax=Bacillus sp. 3255 TaxID=2817904 RepID=UPI0028608783|nr:hypothetical protein [Bacillus sp. 3255]MDR6885224.1 hypothetical protein [Bacillus sp. 3255]
MRFYILAILILGFIMRSPNVQAEELSPGEKIADPESMPYITLLDEFTMYANNTTRPEDSIGRLSSMQSVRMAPLPESELMGILSMTKVPIVTWLGTAWIDLNEGGYKYGKLEWKEQSLTLLSEVQLFDQPNLSTKLALAPQQVHAIASVEECNPYSRCYGKDRWYLIQTSWLGAKWILPYHYAEKYVGEPVEGFISVEETTPVYLYPFEKPLANEPAVKPSILKPTAKYLLVGRAGPSLWYQIQTDDNKLRWIHADSSHGLGFENIQRIEQSFEMTVPFHSYGNPFASYEIVPEHSPQILHFTGQLGDWFFTVIGDKGQWINPSLEYAKQISENDSQHSKLGVKHMLVEVQLDENSVALDIPYVDDQTIHGALKFSKQTVKASLVWQAPNGVTWYYIHTWQGAKWVRQ